MSRIGIYSGTFDPLHEGHIAFAEAAATQCYLDKVVFLPEAKPRHKPDATAHVLRCVELRLQLADRPMFSVAELDECQFSVQETLPQLVTLYGNNLVLLMGSDVAISIRTWPHIEILLARVGLIIGMRQQHTQHQVREYLDQLHATYQIISADYSDMSSSDIRNSKNRQLKNQ